ncbi:MAG TPA: carboxy terminal-processing peptidase [Chitinophagaceae bacterium]|jgi:carboxyl-terminal processing protease|nr:carboxy terminal-processing peptidase [Chitinophagaceae bacterium]
MRFHRSTWIFACLIYSTIHAQLSQTQQQAIVLKRMIELNHYSPRAIDDSLSSEVFVKCIEGLDPRRNIFTSNEINSLSAYRYKLDDELKGSGWSFLDLLMKYYKPALKRADSLINSALQKPLDFIADDKITFSKDKSFNFSASVTELQSRWIKWFKFLLLDNVYDKVSSDSVKSSLKTALPKYEAAIRQKIKKTESGKIQQILNEGTYENYVKNIYFNAIATSFDPHTMYFSPEEKEDFQSSLSSEQFSLGFTVDETNDGKIMITRLIPGGPAWKSGELHKDDELLQLQWQGKQPVDVTVLSSEEVDGILSEINHGNITVKVRKVDGTTRTVTLHKEKIETEENVVRGYVLNGNKKIGYISLPDFYTNWEEEKGSGCANDVAKEIVKLKKENIQGLILDLRFNGGGSVGEALQMIGIFIDEGPLAGEKDKTQKLVFLKDPNRGTIYDGPLLLLINSQSASASEMLAAALQDYNRAVIAGSPSYGKATMQRLFSLDTMSSNNSPSFKKDVVKITDGKIYRVTGQTAQLNGVSPDINLPDIFDAMEYREKFSPDVLQSDTVKRNTYYKPLTILPISELSRLSEQRIAKNKNFQDITTAIKAESQMIKAQIRIIPLQPDAFEKYIVQMEEVKKIFQAEDKYHTDLFTAENHSADKERMKTDAYAKEIDEIVLKNLQQDIYIEEAFNIISDLVKIINK